MPTKKLRRSDKTFYEKLGKRLGKLILEDRGYRSLDAFSLEHHEYIAKPTLYHLVEGKRDPKLSTLRRLSEALELSLDELIGIWTNTSTTVVTLPPVARAERESR